MSEIYKNDGNGDSDLLDLAPLQAAEREYRDSLTPLRRAVYDLQCEMERGLLIFGHHEISEEEIKNRLASAMVEETRASST